MSLANGPFILALASCFLGIAIGVFVVRLAMRGKLSGAFELGRKEFDKDRQALGSEMREQLGRIRGSLIQSIDAYETLATAVEEKLELPDGEIKHILAPEQVKALPETTAAASTETPKSENNGKPQAASVEKKSTAAVEVAVKTANATGAKKVAEPKSLIGKKTESTITQPDLASSTTENASLKNNPSKETPNDISGDVSKRMRVH